MSIYHRHHEFYPGAGSTYTSCVALLATIGKSKPTYRGRQRLLRVPLTCNRFPCTRQEACRQTKGVELNRCKGAPLYSVIRGHVTCRGLQQQIKLLGESSLTQRTAENTRSHMDCIRRSSVMTGSQLRKNKTLEGFRFRRSTTMIFRREELGEAPLLSKGVGTRKTYLKHMLQSAGARHSSIVDALRIVRDDRALARVVETFIMRKNRIDRQNLI